MQSSIVSQYQKCKQAIKRGSLTQLQSILNNSQQLQKQIVSYKDLEGLTLMFHAVIHQDQQFNIAAVDLLEAKGSTVMDREINKQTVLYYIAKDGKNKLMQKMLFNHPQFDLSGNDYMKQTPLYYASRQGQLEIARILIQHGCDVNNKDSNGQTCLFYAASSGHLEMCKFLANKGCNVLHQDRNRTKALNFAKVNGHTQVVEYLSQFKHEAKRNKQRERESSMSSVIKNSKTKKRQLVQNEYCLAYCNENGQIIELSQEQLIEFAQASEDNEMLLKMMRKPQIISTMDEENLPPQTSDKKFQKTATKILNYFWKMESTYLLLIEKDAIYFYEPVDYVRQNLLDYPKIVKNPMDFGTIKRKLLYNAYLDQEQFKNDMNLVFDNCILYNGISSPYGKMSMQMKLEFNATYMKELATY